MLITDLAMAPMGCSPANVAHQSMMNSHAAKRTTVEVELFAGRLVKDRTGRFGLL